MTVSFMTQTVEVIRPSWIESRGDRVPDWTDATEHEVAGCRLQPLEGEAVDSTGAGRPGGFRFALIHKWQLFLPYKPDIQETDRVRHDGAVYEIEGPLRHQDSPTELLRHSAATLQLVEG